MRHETKKLNKTRLSLSLLLIALPWIVLFITTVFIANHSVFSSVPCWSDELTYWHEVLSFSQKGLDFGYYTMNEATPKYLSFGTHGFGTVSVYALFGKIVGWKAYSIVIANAFFMSLALMFLTLIVKTASKNLFIILLFSLTFTPIILFSSTSMTELLNYSLVVIYSGLLHIYFKHSDKNWLVYLLVFCTAISFIRIIYVILFLPLLFKRNEFKFDIKFLLSFVLWIFFSIVLFVINNLFVSPYPDSFLNTLFNSNGFTEFVSNFATHFVQNTWNLLNPFSENSIQVLQRYFVIFVCGISFWKSNLLQTKCRKIVIEYFVVFLILFLFLLINIAAYDVFDWRDYRVLAPALFGCVLFLILNDKKYIAYSSLVFNIIGIALLFLSPQIMKSFNKGRYDKPLKNNLLNHIEYTVNPISRFNNTIFVLQFNTNTVLNIPAGIGISYSDVISDKLKSNYIFTDKKVNLTTYKLIDSNKSGYLYKKL